MKVLSIIEPWATLIKEKKKFIETRSWKTSYRGELLNIWNYNPNNQQE